MNRGHWRSPGDQAVSEAHTAVPIDRRRLAVIIEARGWLRTPYHHMGRVKGCGTDCLMLLAEVYERAGVVPHIDVPFYAPHWNLHRDAERYLGGSWSTRERSRGRLGRVMSWSLNSAVALRTVR
jgi:cell wall-associated NlpC family hydrolase